ncbi:MAG: hypothetical protein J6Y77_02545 [Paludibacteraceae bacterium]|nr:hypothetical protein [Paludibacteraceae bacterium]
MKRLLYIIAILIIATFEQSCGRAIEGEWTCTNARLVGENSEEMSERPSIKEMLSEEVGAKMTFSGDEVIDAHRELVKGSYHFSDDQKVLTVNFKKVSFDGGSKWEDIPKLMTADFDYQIVSLNDKQLIFQYDHGYGLIIEYTYEKK